VAPYGEERDQGVERKREGDRERMRRRETRRERNGEMSYSETTNGLCCTEI